MAVETVQQITRPPEFIEAEAKLYLDQLRPAIAGQKAGDLSQIYGPQYVAGLGQLTQDAISAAGGLGAYQPFYNLLLHYQDQLHISSLCLHINKML